MVNMLNILNPIENILENLAHMVSQNSISQRTVHALCRPLRICMSHLEPSRSQPVIDVADPEEKSLKMKVLDMIVFCYVSFSG